MRTAGNEVTDKGPVIAVNGRVGRRLSDVYFVVVGAALLALSALPVDAQSLGALEADAFRVINDLPGALYWPVWAVMQLGNFLAVPVAAAVAALGRRFRLAAGLAASGLTVWLLAKVLKDLVERGRPKELLPDAVLRHAPAVGQGYPSGHAAVVVALAAVAAPYLTRPLRIVVWALAVVVCLSRVYVGAHLPLDVIGGAAFGLAIGSACNLLLGVPGGTRRPATVTSPHREA